MKNTSKHTPGPWAVEPRQWDHGASLAIVAPNNGYIVAVVPFDADIQTVDEPDMTTVKRHPDDEPNAHLIAAAPAMYEAIKAALDYYRGVFTGNTVTDEMMSSKLEQALAQAEGQA